MIFCLSLRSTYAAMCVACLAAFLYQAPSYGLSSNIGKEDSVCPGGCSPRSDTSSTPQPNVIKPPRSPQEIEEERRKANAKQLNEDAIALMKEGEYGQAVVKFREASHEHPDRIILSNLAHAEAEEAFKAGNFQYAIDKIQAAIALGRGGLRGRLDYFRLQQQSAHDRALTAASRDVIDRNVRWATEPPTPSISPGSSGTVKWDSIQGHLESYLQGAASAGPDWFGRAQNATEGAGIFGRFVFGIWNRVSGAMNALAHLDFAGAAAHLQGINGQADTFHEDAKQFTKEQYSFSAGEESPNWLSKRFAR
jgi:hypothetical protein